MSESPTPPDDARAEPPPRDPDHGPPAPHGPSGPYGSPDPYASGPHPPHPGTGQPPYRPPEHAYPPGPYGPQPGSWAPVPRERSSTAKFWVGAGLSIPAILFVGVLTGALVNALGGRAGDTVAAVVGLLTLGAVVAGLVVERTRWYVLGGIAGVAILSIVAAGACVLLVAAMLGSLG